MPRFAPSLLAAALVAALCLPGAARAGGAAAHPDTAAVLAGLSRAEAARSRALTAVRADVVIELSSRTLAAGGACQGKLAARRPGALRLVGYAAVATVFDAATDGARFQVAIPPQRKAWVGKAGEEAALVGLPMRPGDVVAALFGAPYGQATGPRRLLAAGAHPVLAWTLADGHEVRTRFDAARGLPERAELWEDGASVARLAYHDYRRLSGVWWPTRVDFDWPSEQAHLALTFDHPRFNGDIADSLFTPRVPEGLAVVDAAHASAIDGDRP